MIAKRAVFDQRRSICLRYEATFGAAILEYSERQTFSTSRCCEREPKSNKQSPWKLTPNNQKNVKIEEKKRTKIKREKVKGEDLKKTLK